MTTLGYRIVWLTRNHYVSLGNCLRPPTSVPFDLETDGPNYIVTCEPLTQNGEWVPRGFSPSDFIAPTTRQPLVPGPIRLRLPDIFRLEMEAQAAKTTKFFSN